MLAYWKCECFVKQMWYVCILWQFSMLRSARGNHMEEADYRASPMTALLVAMNDSLCLSYVIHTHKIHILSSTAPTYAPRYRQTPPV